MRSNLPSTEGRLGASLVAQTVRASVCNAGDQGSIPGLGRSPGEGNGSPSSILAWKIPWTMEPGRLPSMGSRRVKGVTRKHLELIKLLYMILWQ